MTRLEAATVELKREWHSLEEVVGASLARVEARLGARRVETDLPLDLPLVPIDALLVQQLLVNLLENAAKYTPEDATIRVSARAATGAVELDVADDGPGLPDGDEERVFEKFHRSAGGHDGFGLGLAIARAIATAHGGTIRAENLRPRGVRLPDRRCPSWARRPEGREAEADVERA